MASLDRVTALRMRAAEARRTAADADEMTRATLLKLADTYERIAERKSRVELHAAVIEVEVPQVPQPSLRTKRASMTSNP